MRPLPGIAALLLLLASSCRAHDVVGFAWKDGAGASLAFAQASGWPEGKEGDFSADRRANRYTLAAAVAAPPASSLIVSIRRERTASAAQRIALSLNPAQGGASQEAPSSFPIRAERVSIALPLVAGSRIASLGVAAEGEPSGFAVESIAIGPAFRGIEGGASLLRVSAGFTLALGQGYQELTIASPLEGLASFPTPGGRGGRRAGIFVEYGPSPVAAELRLEARGRVGQPRAYALRSRPAGGRTVLDPGLLPADCASISLRVPTGVEVSAFYTGELGEQDYALADLGRVLLTDARVEGYALYRWDLLPSVLVLDFQDYAAQDRYLKRLAFFVEKIGFRGRLATDAEIASLHGWNAHDYRPEDLAAFFNAARDRSFPLSPEERELEALLLREGVLSESGGKAEAGKGAIISISRESSEALRRTFAVHESMHALFFSDAAYRGFARSLWASLDAKEKWFWKTYLGWAAYDVGSDYLMGNEFQAYLLQQPTQAAEEYFTKRKSAELLEKHPELEERVAAYMAEFGASFAARAGQLEAWLKAKYGIEAGRDVFLSKR